MSNAASRTASRMLALRQAGIGAGLSFLLPGRETRYVLRLYLQRAVIFMLVALAIILALDVASNLASVLSPDKSAPLVSSVPRIAYYALLRAGYNLPALLPIASIAAVVWAEYGLAASSERIMIFNSSRRPLRSLAPALFFGLFIGVLQFVSLAYVRPASVWAQGANQFRYYGAKFEAPVTTDPQWIAASGSDVYAKIDLGAVTRLRDVLVFSFDDRGKLDAILSAAAASPTGSPGSWKFENGSFWDLQALAAGGVQPPALSAKPFRSMDRGIGLDALWAQDLDVLPELLPQSDLATLVGDGSSLPNAFAYETAYVQRVGDVLLCVGMSLLGATLSLLIFSPRMHPARLLRLVFFGAFAYLASGILPMLGTYNDLPPLVAAWGVPALLIGGSFGVLFRRELRTNAALAAALGGLVHQ